MISLSLDVLKSAPYRRDRTPKPFALVQSDGKMRSASAVSKRSSRRPGTARRRQGPAVCCCFAMNIVPEAEADLSTLIATKSTFRAFPAVPGCLLARRFKIVTAVSEGNHPSSRSII